MDSDGPVVHVFPLLLVLIHVAGIFSIACSPEHPQRNYCTSSWVIKGTILSYTHNPSTMEVYPPIERLYEVQIHRLFKAYNVSDAIWYEGSIASISTDGDMKGTGVDMLQGETYIISGSTFEGQAIITKCNWYQLWKTLSPCHESALETGMFDKNCYCPIATCMGKMCYQQVRDPGCVNNDYKYTYDTCVYESTFNTCSWKKCAHTVDSMSSTQTQSQGSNNAVLGQNAAVSNSQGSKMSLPAQQLEQQQAVQHSQQKLESVHSQQNPNPGFVNPQQQPRPWSTLGMRYAHLRNRRKLRQRRRNVSAMLNAISS